jgi:hypothetical protein
MSPIEQILQEAGERSDSEQKEPESGRRRLVRIERRVVVSRARDADAHADPARRGAYLARAEGRLPEIILDGLASEAEQREAERRCLNQLAREEAAREAAMRLAEYLRERRRSRLPRGRPG